MRPAACALALLAVTASGSAGSAATAPDPLPCPIGATRHAASSVRPHYVLAVKVGRDRFALSGTERIDFAASKRVDRIVLRLWPNSLAQTGARITVSGVRTPGRTSRAAQPDRTTLVVTLAAPARRVLLELAWRLRLPPRQRRQAREVLRRPPAASSHSRLERARLAAGSGLTAARRDRHEPDR